MKVEAVIVVEPGISNEPVHFMGFVRKQFAWHDLWIHMVWSTAPGDMGQLSPLADSVCTGQPDGESVFHDSAIIPYVSGFIV